MSNEWLAERLEMGHNRPVSHLIRQGRKNSEIRKLCSKLEKMLACEDRHPFTHADPAHAATLLEIRTELERWMEQTNDQGRKPKPEVTKNIELM